VISIGSFLKVGYQEAVEVEKSGQIAWRRNWKEELLHSRAVNIRPVKRKNVWEGRGGDIVH